MHLFRKQNGTAFDPSPWRSVRFLVPVIYLATAAAFLADLCRLQSIHYGIIYASLIATSALHRRQRGLWALTAIACSMVLIGAAFPIAAEAQPDSIAGRILSVLAIAAIACFVHRDRLVRDRLAATARRAEASERMKTDVLTNLGLEIPPSLHALLGALSLTMAASPPDQRAALGRVRTDGRKLLATIENLLDLTQLGEHQLTCQPTDLGSIARDAADRARATAGQRQVRIALNPDQDAKAAAIGDSWAMRRIMDNLLDNAVRLTPPGGTVSVSIARGAGMVTASVSDTGNGLPPNLTADNDFEAMTDTGATGLALSKRLARAMNGRLTARNGDIQGAVVSLSLPAA